MSPSPTYRKLRREKLSRRGKLGAAVRAAARMADGPGPAAPDRRRFVQIRIVSGRMGELASTAEGHLLQCFQSGRRCNQFDVFVDGKPHKAMGMARLMRVIAKRFPAVGRRMDVALVSLSIAALLAGCVGPGEEGAPMARMAVDGGLSTVGGRWPAVTWNGVIGQVYMVERAEFSAPNRYRPVDGVWAPPPTVMLYRCTAPGLFRVRTRMKRARWRLA